MLVVTIVPGFLTRFHLLQQCPLDLQIFHDCFDDPIHFTQALEIVFEITDSDQTSQSSLIESGRLRLLGRFQSRGGNLVAGRGIGIRLWHIRLRYISLRRIRHNDVER